MDSSVGSQNNPVQVGSQSMNPTTPTPNSQATSVNGGYTNDPIPQGAQVVSNDYTNEPLPQGAQVVSNEGAPPKPQSDEIQVNPSDNLGVTAAKMGGQVLEGVGEGAIGTVAGIYDVGDKLLRHQLGEDTQPEVADKVSAYLHALAGDNNQNHTFENNVGRAGETLTEFLMGDEALKGLSFADKLTQVAKTAKILEQNGKLMTALRLGVNLSKAAGTLGPEEQAALEKSPILARLVSAGYDAIRNGFTQGIQTEAKTSGNTGEAAKDALEMGLTSGGIGGTLGVIGGAAAKAGKSAETLNALHEAANQAPTSQDVIHDIEKRVSDTLTPEREEAEGQRAAGAKEFGELSANAPSKETITQAAQQAAQAAEQGYHADYNNGVLGIAKDLKNNTIKYEGSPLQQAAINIAGEGQANATPLTNIVGKKVPGSEDVNNMVDRLIHLNEPEPVSEPATKTIPGFTGAEPKPAAVPTKEPYPMDVNELIDVRKMIGEKLRNTGWLTQGDRANRDVYKNLIQGVDDTIGELAQKSGKPDVLARYNQINSDYKASRRLIENPIVQTLLEGRNSELLPKFLQGGESLQNVKEAREFLGEENFNRFTNDLMQRFAADASDDQGNIDYGKVLRQWNTLGKKADVREELFGKMNVDKMTNILNGITGADAKLKEVNDTLAEIMANGNTNALLKDPAKVDRIAGLIGSESMEELGNTVLQNKLREASTITDPETGKLRFDPAKFLDWAATEVKNNPESMHKVFQSTPTARDGFSALLADAKSATAIKRFNKAGLTAASLASGAGLSFLGLQHGFNPIESIAIIPSILGMTYAVDKTAGTDILNDISKSPKLINAVQKAGKIAETLPRSANAGIAKSALAKSIYSGTQSALGGK